jgi:pimeloyl-ACP methyl ester carboxylesterase
MRNDGQRGRRVLTKTICLILCCSDCAPLPTTAFVVVEGERAVCGRPKSTLCHHYHHQRRSSALFKTAASKSSDGESPARVRNVQFISPLLKYGYRPAVDEFEKKTLSNKPLLLYLPGFDGTFLSPFLQFPELHTVFDVRCMTAGSDDRSTLDELRNDVIQFLEQECGAMEGQEGDTGSRNDSAGIRTTQWIGVLSNVAPMETRAKTSSVNAQKSTQTRPVYLAGESFGGILASVVTLTLLEGGNVMVKGLTLINAATCYDRSILAVEGLKVARLHEWAYPFGLLKLLPLFTDKYSTEQLRLILQAKALPSVIDNECREAYMGRVAFSLPFVIPFMAQDTLKWRLTAWLETGCERLAAADKPMSKLKSVRTLIIAGENDATLPSIAEAERLASILPNSVLHVVEGAGHASTCGSRVDLAALFRSRFEELRTPGPTSTPKTNPLNLFQQDYRTTQRNARTTMKDIAANGTGAYFGMEPRYDNAKIGLSPLRYWSKEYYRKHKPRSL